MSEIKAKNAKAANLLEEVIDTLIEVGNGITDEDLHKAADKLLKFREECFENCTLSIHDNLEDIPN
jgi:hypothetical protein